MTQTTHLYSISYFRNGNWTHVGRGYAEWCELVGMCTCLGEKPVKVTYTGKVLFEGKGNQVPHIAPDHTKFMHQGLV